MSESLATVPLDQLATVTMGQSPESAAINTHEDGLPFLQGCADFGRQSPRARAWCSQPLRVARVESTLISVRAPVGTVNRADQDYCIGRGLGAILAKPGYADNDYLLSAVQNSVAFLHRRSQGSTFLAVASQDLKTMPIPSVPLAEQRCIAAILSAIDDAMEHTEVLIAKMQQIKAGLMHDLFTQGILPNGELCPPREEAPQLYKESPLGWIPKEWGIARVDSCGSVKLGRQRSPDQYSGDWSMPYLRVANVFDGYIDFSDVLEMDFTPKERIAFSVLSGDILLNEGQSLELVGRCSLYEGSDNLFCFQNTLIRFRASSGHLPSFYRWLFKLYLDSGRFKTIAKQTTSVAHLGADRFARMLAPLLSLDEQRLIADRLDAEQRLLDNESARTNKLRSLKSGLMHDLHTGRVRIPESMLKKAAIAT